MPRPREIAVGSVRIPAEAIEWQFARSSGPGGQHVNRTSSKAMLRLDVARSPHLPDDVRRRIIARRTGVTADGMLVITSQRHRDQPRNVADCLEKLAAIVAAALVVPKRRRPTRTPRAAVARRLDTKRRRSATKRLRRDAGE